MKDQKNMYLIKTRHEKSRRTIYEYFSYKMGVLNEKMCNKIKLFINIFKRKMIYCQYLLHLLTLHL